MPSILVIEDVPEIRLLLVHMLESAGYRVLEAEDGDSGIRCWRQHRPDLVITDLVMPGKEGLDVIREIRLADGRAKIVAMTGAVYRGNVSLLEEALRLGAIAAFQKPFNISDILRLIKTFLTEGA